MCPLHSTDAWLESLFLPILLNYVKISFCCAIVLPQRYSQPNWIHILHNQIKTREFAITTFTCVYNVFTMLRVNFHAQNSFKLLRLKIIRCTRTSLFQALVLLSNPFICRKYPLMETQIKLHFLFSVELLTRLVSSMDKAFLYTWWGVISHRSRERTA